ncbi:MAG: hypothetical protein ACAI34_01340 [Verrucomicrobium sp.]|nr:hypothetical protein [Verrucomicrobium sp.]
MKLRLLSWPVAAVLLATLAGVSTICAQSEPGVLGLRLNPIPQGMLVGDVSPEGTAAGRIFALDGISEVDGRRIPSTVAEAGEVIRGPMGSSVDLVILRRCSRLIPPVRIPMTIRRGPMIRHSLDEIITDEDYLWHLSRITRQHVIDTSYAEFTNDQHSIRWHLQRLIALEATVEDLGARSRVSKPLRAAVQHAIRFDFTACAISNVWEGFKDQNLQQIRSTGKKLGLELISGSGNGSDTLGDLAAGIIGRSLAQMAANRTYERTRASENPHGRWQSFFNRNYSPSVISPSPFTFQNVEFMTDPHWQFMRSNDVRFDQYPGLGSAIHDYPPVVSTKETGLRARGGYAKIEVKNLAGNGRWRLKVNVPERAKYFFVMVQADQGIIGLTQNPGGYCTWASQYDAFHANNGLIGRETSSYSGNFDFSVIHRDLPILGKEGGPASGNIYMWTSDTLEFPAVLWDVVPTDTL